MGWGKSTQLGYGLGITIGAKLAEPNKLCVNVMGDASFGMTGMDIETASRNKIAILTIVFNNGVMGAERDVLPISDKKYGTMTVGGNYTKVAEGLNVPAMRVDKPANIVGAIKEAVTTTEKGSPFLLEFVVKEGHDFSRYNVPGLVTLTGRAAYGEGSGASYRESHPTRCARDLSSNRCNRGEHAPSSRARQDQNHPSSGTAIQISRSPSAVSTSCRISRKRFAGVVERHLAEPVAGRAGEHHRRHQRHEAADREADEAEGDDLRDVRDQHQRAKRGGVVVAVGRVACHKRRKQRAGRAHEYAEEGRSETEEREAPALGAEASELGQPGHQQHEARRVSHATR